MEFVDRITDLLKRKGVSAAQMSRELDFSNAIFTQWKKNNTLPSTEKLLKLSDYFEVSLEYLVGRSSGVPSENRGIPLSEDEQEMLNLYQQLPEEDKIKVINFSRVVTTTFNADVHAGKIVPRGK